MTSAPPGTLTATRASPGTRRGGPTGPDVSAMVSWPREIEPVALVSSATRLDVSGRCPTTKTREYWVCSPGARATLFRTAVSVHEAPLNASIDPSTEVTA